MTGALVCACSGASGPGLACDSCGRACRVTEGCGGLPGSGGCAGSLGGNMKKMMLVSGSVVGVGVKRIVANPMKRAACAVATATNAPRRT